MIFAGSAAMRAMDAYAIGTYGIPSQQLMYRAATGVTQAAQALVGPAPKNITIFCGTGNNGGDGIGTAALLLSQGYQVRCYLVGRVEKLSPDAKAMEQLLLAQGEQLLPYGEPILAHALRNCDLIVDALFGTGLSRPLGEPYAGLISALNESGIPILSCDIPSGISGDTGAVMGAAIRAHTTITFHCPKSGLLLPPGTEHTGRLLVEDIGIPPEAQAAAEAAGTFVTGELVEKWLPRFSLESHKGDHGKLLLLCGSTGYTGAAALAARAALRTGAGLVYLGVPAQIYPILAAKLEEAVVFPLPCDESGRFSQEAIPQVLSRLPEMDCCLIGPGMGQSDGTLALLQAVLRHGSCPLVLDADGINLAAGHIDELSRVAVPLVLTPHDGEFRRLGGDVAQDRISGTQALAQKTGAVVVRKGYRTVTAAPSGEIYVNSTGNPGMATGGSGDVLAGILACLLGQGMFPAQAAASAVYLHGAAGDECAKALGQRSMLPSDLIAALPTILR